MKKLVTLLFVLGLLVNTTLAQTGSYCASIADSSVYHFTYIKNVKTTGGVNNINNTSWCNSLSGSQGNAAGIAGRYSDYSNSAVPKTKFLRGNTFTLTVTDTVCTQSFAYYAVAVFIDWNRDFDFNDPGERYNLSTNPHFNPVLNASIVVPTNATLGITRMRIVSRMDTGATNLNPCGDPTVKWSGQGETEDYSIEVWNGCTPVVSAPTWGGSIPGNLVLNANPVASDSIVSYLWTKNAGVVGTVASFTLFNRTANDTGNYCVRYTKANGCQETKCMYISNCSPTPVVSQIGQTICAGTSYNFNGRMLTSAGSYADTLKTTRGCDSIVYLTLSVVQCSISCAQYKNFIYTKNGFVYTFSPTSNVPSPYVASYFWTFSNGQSSTQKVPSITSTSPISWARLRICIMDSINNPICCDSIQIDIICNVSCQISKIGDSLKVYASGGSAPYTYLWNTQSNQSRIKISSSWTTYNVTVTDSSGCTTTCSYTVSSPCAQYRNFTYTNTDSIFMFTPTVPAGMNASFNWFKGSQNSTSRVSTFVLTPGYNFVTLIYCLRDSSNNVICCDSLSKDIYYTPSIPCNVNANFNWVASTSNNGMIQFIDSTTPAGTMYTYQWYFGDGTTSISKNPIKTYGSNGTYTVTLVVTRYSNGSNQVCRDTVVKTITLSNVPPCNRFTPNFTWAYSNGAYQITNTTNLTGFNGGTVSYTVSNGSTYNTSNPSLTFTNNGFYAVTMTMTVLDIATGVTCTKTITKYIQVSNSICGNLKANNWYTKNGKTVLFTNTSTGTDSSTVYFYKFGNGATSNSSNPNYTYPLAGLYRVVMIVSKTVGGTTCIDSIVRYISVTTLNPCKDSAYQSSYNCPQYISPVCGCDTVTYQNYCYATKAGVKQYTQGPCPNDTSYVKICGYVYNDINRNCVKDSQDLGLPNVRLSFNTTPSVSTYTNLSGFYTIYLRKGTYTITQHLPTTGIYSQLCPAGAITVNAQNPGIYCNNNFFDTASTCPDLSVVIGRQNRITPGFVSRKWLMYRNNGATAIPNAVLKYRFLSALTVLPATTATYTVSGNIISWNLGTLAPYSSGNKTAHFQTPITLPLGTSVIDSAWIEPLAGDCKPNNNSSIYHDTCVGSYDPNDKSVAPEGNIDPTHLDLNYHVRFQNTGTAPAYNVIIKDILDQNLDLNTLEINSTSHQPMQLILDDNREARFEFMNIMLPDSGTDYEGSMGYVNYSIKRKPNLPLGTEIKNTAAIYFDFNDPIITNTTVNTIYLKSTTVVHTQVKDANIIVYPNPTNASATLRVTSDKPVTIGYRLFDMQGKAIQAESETKANSNYERSIDVETLPKGIYILNVSINGKNESLKLVKE